MPLGTCHPAVKVLLPSRPKPGEGLIDGGVKQPVIKHLAHGCGEGGVEHLLPDLIGIPARTASRANRIGSPCRLRRLGGRWT